MDYAWIHTGIYIHRHTHTHTHTYVCHYVGTCAYVRVSVRVHAWQACADESITSEIVYRYITEYLTYVVSNWKPPSPSGNSCSVKRYTERKVGREIDFWEESKWI